MNHYAGLFARHSLPVILLLLFIATPVMAAEKRLKIKVRHVLAVHSMQAEISSMLQDLGYEWQAVRDPTTQQNVKIASDEGEYRMLYKYVEQPSVQIRVRISKNDSRTKLYLSDNGNITELAEELFSTLKERAEFQFGAENVRD